MSAGTNQTGGTGSGLVKWIDSRLPVFSYHAKGICRVPRHPELQLVLELRRDPDRHARPDDQSTGIFLAMQYTPHTGLAFDSVERIMRDVNFGWLLRYLHANGATFFFIARLHSHVPRYVLRVLQGDRASCCGCWVS